MTNERELFDIASRMAAELRSLVDAGIEAGNDMSDELALLDQWQVALKRYNAEPPRARVLVINSGPLFDEQDVREFIETIIEPVNKPRH